MTKLGFTLPGDHPIIPVMLGDAIAGAGDGCDVLETRRLRRRLLLSGGAEGPGPDPDADVGGAQPRKTATGHRCVHRRSATNGDHANDQQRQHERRW